MMMIRKVKKICSFILSLIALIIFPLNLQGTINVSAFIDFIIFIDPGHGGLDNGADEDSVYEDEINLAVANKLYELCIKKNMIAYISRTGDYDLASLYAKNRKNEDLAKRAEFIEHSNSDIFISIHVNKYSQSKVHGAMVYYEKNNDMSYSLGKYVQKELNLLTQIEKNVHSDNFYLFKKCSVPGILVESGFISNPEERLNLLDDSYQNSLAQAIYQGVYNYYLNSK